VTTIDFTRHLYQPFKLQFNSLLTVWLALEAVQETAAATNPNEPKTADSACSFSIILQGPQFPVLPTRTYELTHPRLGKLELLLAPYQRKQTGMCYKAVVLSTNSLPLL
jgi:hypothetical protein